MNKFNYLMCIRIIAPWIVLFTYKYVFCEFANESLDSQLICSMNWIDGLFFCISITLINLLAILMAKRIGYYPLKIAGIFLLYALLFGAVAFPYMVVSFIQPFKRNTLMHISVIVVIIDVMMLVWENQPSIWSLSSSKELRNRNG